LVLIRLQVIALVAQPY